MHSLPLGAGGATAARRSRPRAAIVALALVVAATTVLVYSAARPLTGPAVAVAAAARLHGRAAVGAHAMRPPAPAAAREAAAEAPPPPLRAVRARRTATVTPLVGRGTPNGTASGLPRYVFLAIVSEAAHFAARAEARRTWLRCLRARSSAYALTLSHRFVIVAGNASAPPDEAGGAWRGGSAAELAAALTREAADVDATGYSDAAGTAALAAAKAAAARAAPGSSPGVRMGVMIRDDARNRRSRYTPPPPIGDVLVVPPALPSGGGAGTTAAVEPNVTRVGAAALAWFAAAHALRWPRAAANGAGLRWGGGAALPPAVVPVWALPPGAPAAPAATRGGAPPAASVATRRDARVLFPDLPLPSPPPKRERSAESSAAREAAARMPRYDFDARVINGADDVDCYALLGLG